APLELQRGDVELACGGRLAYEQTTSVGPLVLFFHGTPGSRREAALVHHEALAAGIRLVAVDRPGMGHSTHQPNRKILDWPAQVEQLADALGAANEPFGILALSGGAPYALACVRAMPHRLRHVAVASGHTPMGPVCAPEGSQDAKMAWVARHPRLAGRLVDVVDKRLDRRPDQTVQMLAKSWSCADRQLVFGDPWLKRQLVKNLELATRCGSDGVVRDIQILGSCWGFSLCEAQGVGVSFWHGGCDEIAPPAMGRYFQRQVAGSELQIDPRAGHVTMLKWHAAEIFARLA
ncbi:MAG: alpha/beta hydrolase, partial [Planctomycetales bacterium]|nr:alpha/beta hydrolase [Planctomycetales bacterium]